MSQPVEEIAKELVVAWLSHHLIPFDNPESTGKMIASIYLSAVQTVEEQRGRRRKESEQRHGPLLGDMPRSY